MLLSGCASGSAPTIPIIPTASPVPAAPLPTSSASSGSSPGGAPLAGLLSLDSNGCFRVVRPGGPVVTPVWPSGFTASTQDGAHVVLSSSGAVVGRAGTDLTVYGRFPGSSERLDSECAIDTPLFFVESTG